MRFVVACLLGCLLGAALALTVVYYNPLTMRAGAAEDASEWRLDFSVPDGDLLAFTHGGLDGLPEIPHGLVSLWEEAVATSAILTTTLSGDAGPVALGTRISVPSQRTNLLVDGVIIDDYWLISVPGRGSLFAHVENNVWPLIRENVIPVSWLRQPWGGSRIYRPTLGPGAAKRGRVFGVSGEFAGADGRASELHRLDGYSADAGIEALGIELRLDVPRPDLADALSLDAP